MGKLQRMADRTLTDSVLIQSETTAPATRAQMSAGATVTLTTGTTWRARISTQVTTDTDTTTADRETRDVTVWLPPDAGVSAGDRCTIVTCADSSLVGEAGRVLTVERQTTRAVRRATVRMFRD